MMAFSEIAETGKEVPEAIAKAGERAVTDISLDAVGSGDRKSVV